jgi:predicted enzyme related to lactoylglutathione lyase
MTQIEQDRRIDYIEIRVTDMESAKLFYTSAFGWTFKDYGPTYASFFDGRLGGGLTEVDTVSPGGVLVVLYAVDLDVAVRRIQSAGGTIVKDIFSFPGGRRFHFADPTGNEMAIWSDDSD